MADGHPEELITRYLPGRPQGRPDDILALAVEIRGLREGILRAVDGANQGASTAMQSWTGSASVAFHDEWSQFASEVKTFGTSLDQCATQIEQYASSLREAQQAYDQALIAVGVTVVVGLLLTTVTFGASDVAAGEAIAAEVATASAMVARLVAVAEVGLRALAQELAAIFPRLLIKFAVPAVSGQIVSSLVVYQGENPLDHFHLDQAILNAALPAGGGALASGVEKLGLTGLRNVAAHMAAQGGLTGAVDAGGQLLRSGKIDFNELLFATGVGAGFGAAVPALGRFGSRGKPGSSTQAVDTVSGAAPVAARVRIPVDLRTTNFNGPPWSESQVQAITEQVLDSTHLERHLPQIPYRDAMTQMRTLRWGTFMQSDGLILKDRMRNGIFYSRDAGIASLTKVLTERQDEIAAWLRTNSMEPLKLIGRNEVPVGVTSIYRNPWVADTNLAEHRTFLYLWRIQGNPDAFRVVTFFPYGL